MSRRARGILAISLNVVVTMSSWFAILGVTLIFVVVLAQVGSRAFLRDSLVWSDEIARLTLVATTFLGLAWAEGQRAHVSLGRAVSRTESAWQHWITIMGRLLAAITLVVVAHGSLAYAAELDISTPAAGVPLRLIYGVVGVGVLLWTTVMLLQPLSDAANEGGDQ